MFGHVVGRSRLDIPRPHWPALAVTMAALSLLAVGPGDARAGTIDVRELDQSGVRDYWTPARMRAAEPLDAVAPDPDAPGGPPARAAGPPTAVAAVDPGSAEVAELSGGTVLDEPTAQAEHVDRDEITDPAAEPFRSHGKVFLTITGGSAPGNYVCSGTAVASNNRSVVWSAGHCVFDTAGGGYASNWMFAPAYKNGATPFGEWVAKKLAAPKQWRDAGNLSYDLGAAEVEEMPSGESLTELVGGRGIGFNQPRNQTYESFGYPAQQPPLEFTGGREFRCTAPLGGTDNAGPGPDTMFIPCDMTGGSSGGGWVAGDSVLSVNSYSYCIGGLICEERLYGPYQDGTGEQLYEEIAGDAVFCNREKVTHLGTSGPDDLVGTSGDDVFKALGGSDEISGKAGKDIACAGGGKDRVEGGKGKDKLLGQKGKDKLLGQKGKDSLNGNKGKDSCNGGPGKDKANNCKKTTNVP